MSNIEGAKPDQAHSVIIILLSAAFVPIMYEMNIDRQTEALPGLLSAPIINNNKLTLMYDIYLL